MSVLVSADAVRTTEGILGTAVLVEGERVVAVGDREHLLVPGVTEERYPGSVIVPGLVDTHIHPVGIAGLAAGADLHDAGDLAGVVAIPARPRLRPMSRYPPSRSALSGSVCGMSPGPKVA